MIKNIKYCKNCNLDILLDYFLLNYKVNTFKRLSILEL